jgi:hypothetical protein
LLGKKLIQIQNGILYDKCLKFWLKDPNAKKLFKYLTELKVKDDIFSFSDGFALLLDKNK